MTVELLDPANRADREAWLGFWREVLAHDLPDDVPPAPTETTCWLHSYGGSRTESWAVRDQAGIAGIVRLIMPDGDNARLIWSKLFVRPDARRRGHGRELHAHAVERAAADGRHTINISAPGTPAGHAFAAAVGAKQTLRMARYLYRLDRPPAIAEPPPVEPPPGYDFVRWIGACPAEYLDEYLNAMTGMMDSPVAEETGWVPPTPEADKALATVRTLHDLGAREYVICARESATGAFAGLTQVCVWGDGRAEQDDTTVLAAHRGHGLGLRMKAAMLGWLSEAEPDLRQVETWNDVTNGPMIRVNVALGCRFAEEWPTWTSTLG